MDLTAVGGDIEAHVMGVPRSGLPTNSWPSSDLASALPFSGGILLDGHVHLECSCTMTWPIGEKLQLKVLL